MSSKTVQQGSDQRAMGSDYMLFLGTDENLIDTARGVLDNTVEGSLILTDKKLFFYYVSNICRDKVFIATHAYLKSVELKNGLFNSTLIIESKNKSFKVQKINRKQAKKFYERLEKIIIKNN